VIATNAKLNVPLMTKRMEIKGLTEGDVAEAVGVDKKTVSRWLAGDLPKTEALTRIAVLLSGSVIVGLDGDADEALVIYDHPYRKQVAEGAPQ